MNKLAASGRYVRGCMTAAVQEMVGHIHDMSLDNPAGEQCDENKRTVKYFFVCRFGHF